MKQKKVVLAFPLLAICLLLGGCQGDLQERMPANVTAIISPSGAAPESDRDESETIQAILYYPDGAADKLVRMFRTVTVSGTQNRAEAVLAALMEGPLPEDGSLLWPEELSEKAEIEISGNTAFVNLSVNARMVPERTLFAVRTAISQTLIELDGISYVDVLIGGREEGLELAGTLPVGVQEYSSASSLQSEYERLDGQKSSGTAFTRLAALYFPADDFKTVLPEIRRLSFTQANDLEYLYVLLEEIGKGQTAVPAPMDYIEEMPDIISTENGAYRVIDIRFGSSLTEALSSAGVPEAIYMAMMTDTLMGFVPGVEGVRVTIGENQVVSVPSDETELHFDNGIMTRKNFADLLGDAVVLYTRSETAGKLQKKEVSIPASRKELLRSRLETLFSSSSAIPDGFAAEDILAIETSGNVIRVNLTEHAAAVLSGLDEEDARLAVYAMVNTLTEKFPRAAVEFFFDGEQIGTLGDSLEMRGSFLRNSGMVVSR